MPCKLISTSLLSRTSPATHVFANAGGRFFAPKYQANASWAIIEGKLHVDWAKYGKYQLAITNESPPAFEVCAVTQTCKLLPTVSHAYILHHVSRACVYYICL
jgi:hypothetical protein